MMKEVLVVDDDPAVRNALKKSLTKRGYKTITVPSGEEAIKKIKDRRPDLVLLDIRMPGMDGVETLRKIRDFDKKLPVIMVTAHRAEKKMAHAIKLGISGFFLKTPDLTEVIKSIETALRTLRY